MSDKSICVISRNPVWSECLRRKLAPRWSVIRYDQADECLKNYEEPCSCAIVNLSKPGEFENCLRLPTEFLRREAAAPVIFLIDPRRSASVAACWEAGAAAVLSPSMSI